MYQILIVEDDNTIATQIAEHLQHWGYRTLIAPDLTQITSTVQQEQPHLILLDLMLPHFNGFHWCQEIRKITTTPIIFLSSAADNLNIVMAVNLGGDDFIAKPFDLNVLTAKIQALLRRTYAVQGQSQLIEYQGLRLNLSDASLEYGDKRLELTKNEFKILALLLENAGKVISRDTIMARLWDSDSFIDDNTLTVNMTRLRKKLAELNLPGWLKTKKGLGYLLQQGEEAPDED